MRGIAGLVLPFVRTERLPSGSASLHLERRAAIPDAADARFDAGGAGVAKVDELLACAATACARGALETAADAYRQAAAIEARTGDLERALACLRMACSLRAEIVRNEQLPSA